MIATLKALLGKATLPVIIGLGSFIGGTWYNQARQQPCPDCVCPDLSCPEPTVAVQPFEVDKIKGLKHFEYSPQYSGNIKVEGIDSVFVGRVIEESIERSVKKHLRR